MYNYTVLVMVGACMQCTYVTYHVHVYTCTFGAHYAPLKVSMYMYNVINLSCEQLHDNVLNTDLDVMNEVTQCAGPVSCIRTIVAWVFKGQHPCTTHTL